MKSLRFKIPNGPYNAGEIAGFEDKVADRLITWGIAEEVKQEKPKPEKPSAKQTKPVTPDAEEEKPKSNRGRKRKYVTKSAGNSESATYTESIESTE